MLCSFLFVESAKTRLVLRFCTAKKSKVVIDLNLRLDDEAIGACHLGETLTRQRLQRIDGEDEQVQKLLKRKGAFSAAAIWNICGTRVGNARVTLRAQREQLALEEAKANAVAQNKMSWQSKNLENAQQALVKYQTRGNSALTDKDWGDIVR